MTLNQRVKIIITWKPWRGPCQDLGALHPGPPGTFSFLSLFSLDNLIHFHLWIMTHTSLWTPGLHIQLLTCHFYWEGSLVPQTDHVYNGALEFPLRTHFSSTGEANSYSWKARGHPCFAPISCPTSAESQSVSKEDPFLPSLAIFLA